MPDSTTPGQRFLQLIQQLGFTKNAFAQSLGKTATVIQHIVDERNKPGYDLLNRVCEVYPNVSSDWLLRGLGPMLRQGTPTPLPAEAAPARPAPVADGIDPSEVPHSPRRRTGNLLQPADIVATLALATPSLNGAGNGHAASVAAVAPAAASPAATGPAVSVPAAPPAPVEAAPAAVPVQPAAPPVVAPVPAAMPAAPTAPPVAALPDPAYLAAALQTQHLQHQLALAEQRNQHLLEQQVLLRQMVELLQR